MHICEKYFNMRKPYFDDLPKTIIIEPYMGCNLRCPMCPVPHSMELMNGRKYCEMDFELFTSIIDQISDVPRRIQIIQMGEPLLNKNIVKFVRLAKQRGHDVAITSNGVLMDYNVSVSLIKAGIDEVVFSFDGMDKKTYESIRVGANHQKVIGNIKTFANEVKHQNSKCITRLDYIVSDLTKPEINKAKKFWKGIIPVYFRPLGNWNNMELPSELGSPKIDKCKPERFPCNMLWTVLSISAEGYVQYCCHDYKLLSELSNVKNKPIKEIWHNEVGKEREKHINNQIDSEPCKNCMQWSYQKVKFDNNSAIRQIIKKKFPILKKIYQRYHDGTDKLAE
jgi:radical SAM protein with 4Fe4S-binding SPASM domain